MVVNKINKIKLLLIKLNSLLSRIVNWGFGDFIFLRNKKNLKHLKNLKPEFF